ncbi:MAG: hypothetical protein IPK42_25150, partial [Betaproteobacteria bacterium]|nr:hypothetical protein [Betaproteobacteria bacterium]
MNSIVMATAARDAHRQPQFARRRRAPAYGREGSTRRMAVKMPTGTAQILPLHVHSRPPVAWRLVDDPLPHAFRIWEVQASASESDLAGNQA